MYLRELRHEVGRGRPLDDLDDCDAPRLPHADLVAAILADGGRPDLLGVDGLDALGVVVQDDVAADAATETDFATLWKERNFYSCDLRHAL